MSKYRLQTVLDVRGKAKQEAARVVASRREQLAAARAELQRREEAVNECQSRIEGAFATMTERAAPGIEVKELVGYRTHLADLRRMKVELLAQVEEQRGAVAQAELAVERAVAALIEAAREVEVIEKHRENWAQHEKREEERRDQKLAGEISSIIYERGRRK